jgi:PAS domain S-box-containing protein
MELHPQRSSPGFDREQMARALSDSEERLRSVVDSASMVLWALDRDGIFTFSQGRALGALGLEPAEVVGRSVFEMYADSPRILEDHRRALRGEEFTSITEIGGITFESRYSSLRDADGQLTGVIGIGVDVTERRRAEADREQAVSLLQATLESTADGILVVDEEGRIASFNGKFAEMWQIPQDILENGRDEEAIAHVLSKLRDPEGFVAKVKELYAIPRAESFDVLHFLDGRTFERYSQPQRVGDQVVGRVWSFRDVTARRQAEEELRQREAQLGHTQRLAHLGSWQWDPADNSVVWSEELYRIYGLTPGEFPATFEGYLARVHPDDRERVQAAIGAVLGSGGPFDFVERIIRPTGEIRYLHSQGEAVQDATGAVVRLVGACQDITERQLAEDGLRNAEASYRAIFELSNDAIFIHDLETGAIVDANRAACDLHQCTLDELKELGVPGISDGSPPYTGEAARAMLEKAAAGEPQLFEWLVRRASGERFWVEVNLRRVAINGQDRLLATARDITQRRAAEAILKRSHEELEGIVAERTSELAQTNMALEEEIAERERAEEDLRQRTAELEAVFRALPDLYFRLDPGGGILEYRSGADSSLYLAPASYVGERFQDLVPAESRGAVENAFDEVAATGRLVVVQYALPFEGGDRYFEARILPFADGQFIAIARDITNRARAERALRESEEHFRRLIENSSDVATILGPDGINRYQSPSIQYVLGHTPEEMVGTSAFERIHPEDAVQCGEVLKEVVRNPGETRSVEFRYRHKDGSWRVLEARARTLLPDSAAEGVVINSRDITERKRYEEALQQAKREAEEANRSKSDFLSRMSHELRTPMNSILGFGQLLERRDLPADQRRSVEHILKAGRHLLNLINEVLEISRIEAGRQNFSLEPVQLSTVLKEARSLIQPLAVQRGLALEPFSIPEDIFVHADRQRLVQVLLNLLSNGVKYNRPGGSVAITQVETAMEDGRRSVRIGIHDTGPGIEAERMSRLFVPFERLGAEQSGEEGTGLGLALSKRLVEAMGGILTAESEVGVGSTFWLELERVAAPFQDVELAVARSGVAIGSAGGGRPATVLYIEDNLPNLSLIESIFADRPEIKLLSALQGQMGLYLAWEHRPDVILLDLHLPDIHGDEVLRRLREDPRSSDTPVVMVSADATVRTVERLTRAGASAYLTKPLDVEEFLETLQRFIEAGRGESSEPRGIEGAKPLA